MTMTNEPKEKIVETISSIPADLGIDDVSDFCSLARYYSLKTPTSFRKVSFYKFTHQSH